MSPTLFPVRIAAIVLVTVAGTALAATDVPTPPVQAPQTESVTKKATVHSAKKTPAAKPSRYTPDRFAGRAGKYYENFWGIDSLSVKLVESGELVRFNYRVLDPAKAAALNDKKASPSLNDPRAGVSLVVPTMEKVGQLRQSSVPEAGRSYWMTFSNKGQRVVRGDRVDVVIGTFKAGFLTVE
jgi:hypothetical protein